MIAGSYPRLVIIDSKAKNIRGFPLNQVRDADVVVGKGNVVLKDREGPEGRTLTSRELDNMRESADEVIER